MSTTRITVILLSILVCTPFCGRTLGSEPRTMKPAQPQAIDPTQPVTIGRWMCRCLPDGLYLDYDHIPLMRGSMVQLFAADYARGYYSSSTNSPATAVETLADGGRAYTTSYKTTSDERTLTAQQRVEVHPDDRINWTLTAKWSAPDAVLLEWNPVRLWAYALIGAKYDAQTPDGTIKGTIGLLPKSGAYPASRLSAPWHRMVLHNTAIGQLDFAATGSDLPVLFDGREDEYMRGDKLFWGGWMGIPLAPKTELTRTLSLTVVPKNPTPLLHSFATQNGEKPAHIAALIPESKVTRIETSKALSPLPPLTDANGDPLIIPRPKSAKFSKDFFVPDSSLPIVTHLHDSVEGRNVTADVRRFADELKSSGIIAKINLQSSNPSAKREWNGHGLYVGVLETIHRNSANPIPLIRESSAADPLPVPPDKAEGYALRVTPTGISIVGRDAAGAFYGLQTLRQLVQTIHDHDSIKRSEGKQVERDGRQKEQIAQLRFPCGEIADYPSLKFRGAHIFVGRNALPFHTKLIERIFSRFKMNALVLECEYTQWKSHPEIRVPNAMPENDLRAEVADARARFLEPIPLVNSLGHSEWIFANDQHADLAEDVHSRHAYDASNPASYKFLFDIYAEALDIFKPRLFHIGHDEVKIPGNNVFGKYPARPANIKKGVTKLFVEDVNRISDWLKVRGARPMLWGDMLLHDSEGVPIKGAETLSAANAPSVAEAKSRRRQLPKDALIADWRYEAGSERNNGLSVLQSAGFETVGSAWYEPENIRGWAAEAIKNGSPGTLQTTWAGYDSNEALLDEEYRQFTAYVLAAEYAWSGTDLHPLLPVHNRDVKKLPAASALPYSAASVFARAYRGTQDGAKPTSGWLLDLRLAANFRLLHKSNFGYPYELFSSPSTTQVRRGISSSVESIATKQTSTRGKTVTTTVDPATGIRILSPDSGIMLASVLPPPTAQSPSDKGDATKSVPSRVVLPDAISLPIGASAGALAFVHATALSAPAGTTVAHYIVSYADGKSIEIPLRYGREIRALDDDTPSNSYSVGALIWRHNPAQLLTLRLYRWTNPRPKVIIARIEFYADTDTSAPILFGVTGW